MFAVIDIETTGGSPKNEKITEIAIFIHDGLTIVDEFVTLIDPEINIPYYITGLTGITNEMVADAPKFYEIARKIVELTEDQIFVAHNVNFDYSFVRNEFKNLGYDYSRKTLDTIRLARQLVPGLPSYFLGKLCSSIGISLNNRHRAGGDALATVKLLEELLNRDHKNIAAKILKPGHPEGLNEHITKKILNKLPEETGVYYFWNEKQELIYNQAQRRSIFNYGLFAFEDKNGYINFSIINTNDTEAPLTTFTSKREGRELLTQWVENYKLCHKLSGLYDSGGACFHKGIGECYGACTGEEPAESYNLRVQNFLKRFEYEHQDFLIIDREILRDTIRFYPDNRDIHALIRLYLRKNNAKVLPL
ncbi:MAG: exonuclease domain-containing protein [Bacteroidales bacterium]